MELGSELDRFVQDVHTIKDDMKTMEKLHKRLQDLNEESKAIHDAATMKELRSIMDSDVDHVLILSKAIMKRLEGLERSSNNTGKVNIGVGPDGSSIDRTRISVVLGMGKKLRETMDAFQGLRVQMAAVYKETLEFKFYSVTGERKYVESIENLLSTGEIEALLNEAIQEHGAGPILNVVDEMQERREGAKYMQRNLIDLHQILLDMVGLLEAHGQQKLNGPNDQNNAMPRGSSFVRPGAAQLQDNYGNNEKAAKKRATIALVLVVVLIVILIVPLFKMETEKGRE